VPASSTARLLGLCLIAFLGSGCAAAPDEEPADESSDAIVGDELANDEHPEVVMLLIERGEKLKICTGTLVGLRTVMTARHCLDDGAIRADGTCSGKAHVDTEDRGAKAGTKYAFERCVLPDLGRPTRENDIAFVQLAKPVAGITPARLAVEAPRTNAFTAYGYGDFGAANGKRCENDTDQNNKRKVAYRGRLKTHFARLVCSGDSGGPHFVADTNVVAGVTSAVSSFGVDFTSLTYPYAAQLAAQVAKLESPGTK
jgi:secreted trypsin-like serine protease